MKRLLSLLLLLLPMAVGAQFSAVDSIVAFHKTTALNSGKIPQELIYLHLDNTSYYRDDRIFFAGYLVNAGSLKPSELSRTVYVELLNPSGKIIDRCILRVKDGRFHGSLLVNETPFYSGFYEIRAYTRYMLNFGPEAMFSRVLPVYRQPQTEGDWAERTMLLYGSPKMTFTRPKPAKVNRMEASFYPEGGKLVNGLPATVAFELTDEARRPLEASGRIVDGNGTVVATFSSGHQGRGAFSFVPSASEKYKAEFDVGGKAYSVKLPKVEREGISLSVDNLSDADSVRIRVSRTAGFPVRAVGASLTCRGELHGRAVLDLDGDSVASFAYPRAKLPSGVIALTLFDSSGTPLTDRLFFNSRSEDFVDITCEFDKPSYGPHERVTMRVKTTAARTPMSLSVTDAAGSNVAYGSNILADLLLASEIKGYVHNPAWYFADPADPTRREALDRLLMIQGWRRYRWPQLAGTEPVRIDSLPEQGISLKGRVLRRFSNRPRPNATVNLYMHRLDTVMCSSRYAMEKFESDSLGLFSCTVDLDGNWIMLLNDNRNITVR